MSNPFYHTPIDEKQRHKIRKAMANLDSLADITRTESVQRVINYLLEDKSSMEQYFTGMAKLFTAQRNQVTYASLLRSVFHERRGVPEYGEDFRAMLTKTVETEKKIQKRLFIAENRLQIDIGSDHWKIYQQYGDILKLVSLNFSAVRCSSLRSELKYYYRHIYRSKAKLNNSLFSPCFTALNILTEINPKIRYFADITDADAKALLLFLENTYRKKNGATLSQSYIAWAVNKIKGIFEYLMSDMRDKCIRAPQPHMNPFAKFTFRNLCEYRKPTLIIPEGVIEQINKHLDELPPTHRIIYDVFVNSGLRLKEVFLLEADCIESSRYDDVFQLKFKAHKTLAARRRNGLGDYHRIMITKTLAENLICHINSTAAIREVKETSYIFFSQNSELTKAVIAPSTFISKIRNIIKKHNIRDENGLLWHITSRQFRKTIAVTLIENGATTAELAYWLGHLNIRTAALYYAEVRKMKLAEFNTKFFKEKFELVISKEQLETYTEEERKLLYVDFRLEQRRVELGYCLLKVADGRCPNRNSLYNCVNCKNLCTGKKYLPYWNELLSQQKEIVEGLICVYRANDIEGYIDFAEYKQELHLLKGYENIVTAITEGGVSYE
jgi:integrase